MYKEKLSNIMENDYKLENNNNLLYSVQKLKG